jgi:hypothetical protein
MKGDGRRSCRGLLTVKLVVALGLFVSGLILSSAYFQSGLYGESKNTSESNEYNIENRYLEVIFDSQDNHFTILNKLNGLRYKTGSLSCLSTTDVVVYGSTGIVIIMEYNSKDERFRVKANITIEDDRIKGVLRASQNASFDEAFAFPGPIYAPEKKQYFVMPYAEGILIPADEECPFGDFQMWGHKSTMPFMGVTNMKSGVMISSDTPCDTSVVFTKPTGSNEKNKMMTLYHSPSKGRFGYDRVFFMDFIENDGYNEMADVYRKHLESEQGIMKDTDILVTFKEKIEKNPNIEKLAGAVDFWLGASEMKERWIVDELKSNGINKALINFQYGWNIYEHEKRPEIVQYVLQNGMIPSRYDNYSCVFEIGAKILNPRFRTEGFDEHVIVKHNGELQEGYDVPYKGYKVRGYRLNTGYSYETADVYVGNDLKENSYLGRFVDVMLSSSLYEDYSPRHPMTRTEDMNLRYNTLELIRSKYNQVIGTEETTLWAAGVSDYSEGTMSIVQPPGSGDDWTTPITHPGELYIKYTVNPAVRIPLKSLVYHDCHISGWYTGDSISKVPEYWKTKELLTILYGAMNLVFPQSAQYLSENKEKFLWSIKACGRVFEKVAFEAMEKHDFLTEDRLVQSTLFSNGLKIYANFSDKSFLVNGNELGANDFLVEYDSDYYTSDMIVQNTL